MTCSVYRFSAYHRLAPTTLWNASDNTASRSDFAEKVGFSYLLGQKPPARESWGPTTTEDPENLKVCPCIRRLRLRLLILTSESGYSSSVTRSNQTTSSAFITMCDGGTVPVLHPIAGDRHIPSVEFAGFLAILLTPSLTGGH